LTKKWSHMTITYERVMCTLKIKQICRFFKDRMKVFPLCIVNTHTHHKIILCGKDTKSTMMKTLTMHILRSNVYCQNTTLGMYFHKEHIHTPPQLCWLLDLICLAHFEHIDHSLFTIAWSLYTISNPCDDHVVRIACYNL